MTCNKSPFQYYIYSALSIPKRSYFFATVVSMKQTRKNLHRALAGIDKVRFAKISRESQKVNFKPIKKLA